jgi:hypothetical protein
VQDGKIGRKRLTTNISTNTPYPTTNVIKISELRNFRRMGLLPLRGNLNRGFRSSNGMDEEGFSASVTSIGGVLADFEDPVDASILPRTSSSTLRSISVRAEDRTVREKRSVAGGEHASTRTIMSLWRQAVKPRWG